MRVRPCALIIERNCVLTMKYRYGGADVYALPGGNPDPGESLSEVIIRELREELGIETEVDQLVLCGEVIGGDERKDALHAVFIVHMVAGLPQLNPEHTSAVSIEWLSINELDTKHLYPNVGQAVRAYLEGMLRGVYLGKIDQPYVE
ncbi:NUDIX domain-containing protein [Salmonirosea aquatica]|uniref:NUDIX domain-containing protein n=1 Tax=Salmonirosea aquatica TaxID=2654236 RepID=A0A7C9FPA8_9BACT|nr:NUDIX domain-containing protein [Cytophagaceae bacterium SJW1-29]